MIGFDEHDAVSVGSERSFGLVFAVVFAIVALWPLTHGAGPRWWAFAVALGFAAAGFLAPRVLRPLNILWFRFGLLLGRIAGPVVIGVIFFVAVTPTALIFKLLGKDPLRLKADESSNSYWIERDEARHGSMRDQF